MPYVESGEFERDTSYVTDRITRDGRDGWPVEAGRYRLVVEPGVPVGQPGDRRAAAAGARGRALDGGLRTCP